jgi:AcrR family transcriptional regulator
MVKKKQKQTDASAEERILQAARKVFMTKGMAGARMQDIADEAGINKALLHYYFKDKEKLFETIFMEEAKKFFPKINSIFQADIPLFEKFSVFVSEYIDEMLRNPYLPMFVMTEVNRNPEQFIDIIWGKDNLPNPSGFFKQIEKEIKKGSIKRVNPMQLLMNLISMTVFPFIARPMVLRIMQVEESQFRAAMELRKKEIPQFIIDSITK